MNRRRFVVLSVIWPIAGLAGRIPENPIDGMRRWGSGEFRRFGFLIYDATLWAGSDDPVKPPLALRLTYRRDLAGMDIANASTQEIRRLGIADDTQLGLWGKQMRKVFPDVHPGDHILGLYLERGAQFFYNDRPIGNIDDPAFARAFFAIWIDPKTSAPGLRSALLKAPS